MSKIPRKPNGICRIRAGEFPDAWDFGIVEIRDRGEWGPHPAFPPKEQGGSSSFNIELQSDLIEQIWQSHLSLYDGKTPFCIRAHRQDDLPGVALRRTKLGAYKKIECDPAQCPLHQQHINKGSKAGYIKKDYQQLYPYAKLAYKDKKGRDVIMDCHGLGFLTFALLDDDWNYIHSPAEFSYFQTRGEVNHGRFLNSLRRLAIMTNFRLRGLRLKLVFEPFMSRWGEKGRLTPSWILRVPNDTEFREQVQQAALRAGDPLPALPSPSEMLEMGEEMNLTEWTQAAAPELAKEAMQLDSLDSHRINAEYIDIDTVSLIARDPAVIDITKRLKMSYDQRVQLDLAFEDVYWAVEWLQQRATKKGIPIDDILRRHGYESFIITEAAVEPADEPEQQDDDIETVEHDPQPVDDDTNELFKGGTK